MLGGKSDSSAGWLKLVDGLADCGADVVTDVAAALKQ